MEGFLRSHLYAREDRILYPEDEEFYFPVRQYMTLHLSELGAPGWSFHGAGWVRQDLAENSDYAYYAADQSFESELLSGYLEWRDPLQPNTYFRAGRQYFFPGGVYERFDGLTWSKQFQCGHGYALFGGSPVIHDYEGNNNDRVGGGRAWVRPWMGAELGVSYAYKTDNGEVDREIIGQDFFWRPAHWMELSEHVVYDRISQEIVDLGLFAGLKFHPRAKLTLSYNEVIPGALLPKTSVLSVFSNDVIQDLAVGLEYDLCRNWRFWTEGIRHDSESPGGANPAFHVEGRPYWEYRLGGRYDYGDNCHLLLELRHLEPPEQGIGFVEGDYRYESIDNGFDRIRLADHHYFNPYWWTSWEIAVTSYRDPVDNDTASYSVAQTLGYRPSKRIEAVATLRYEDSAVDNTEIQALFSVTYWFDKRMNDGVTQDLLADPPGYGGRWLPHTDLPVPAFYRGPR
jgi:hypothetical protein